MKHIEEEWVTDAKVAPLPYYSKQFPAKGYGGKIPTRYMIKINTRWHRVYVMQYANSGSAYVLINKEVHFLDTGTEHLLQRM